MSSIPFRDAIISCFPAVQYSVLPMKSLFPHCWLCRVEWIKAKSCISCYYSHFIPHFMLFSFASFSLWPTSSDRFVGGNISIYIPTAYGLFKLKPSGILPLCVCLSYLLFEMDWLAVPTPVGLSFWSEWHITELKRIQICTRVQHPDYRLWPEWTRHTLALVALTLQ